MLSTNPIVYELIATGQMSVNMQPSRHGTVLLTVDIRPDFTMQVACQSQYEIAHYMDAAVRGAAIQYMVAYAAQEPELTAEQLASEAQRAFKLSNKQEVGQALAVWAAEVLELPAPATRQDYDLSLVLGSFNLSDVNEALRQLMLRAMQQAWHLGRGAA